MRIAVLMVIGSPWSRQIALHLAELGHSVHVIDFRRHRPSSGYLYARDEFQSESVALLHKSVAGVHFLNSRFRSGMSYLTCPRQVRRVCRDCGADSLLTLYCGGFGTLARLSGVRPYAVYVVGSDVLMAQGVTRWISRHTLSAADVVFANGNYLAEKTRELSPRAKVVPLLIGVDTTRFTPGTAAENKTVKVLCTRGFLPVYNNEYLIQGLAALPRQDADVRVTFPSTGNTLDAVRTLADQTLSPSIRRNVEFLGGVTDDEMLTNLQNANVFVSLSRSDGTSVSLLEALSCGLFPVLSDIPQNREWIDPASENGILVPLDRPDALAAALNRAISDSALRAHAAKINRQLTLDRADIRNNMAALASKLEAAVAAKGRT